MGCGYSDRFTVAYASPQYQAWNQSWMALKISKGEVFKLYKKFQKVDMDHSGSIDVVELLTVLDVERTKFTERVFSIFDEDSSGNVDFNEFVLSLWNYCTLTKVTLGMFAFDLYDRDSSGLLEHKDIVMMLRDIYGKDAETGHYARQTKKDLEEFLKEGEINLDRFLLFCRNHHSLLFPAFQMQLMLKKNILGVAFWEKCAQRRVQLSKKKYITIKQILELQALESKKEALKDVQVKTTAGKVAIQSLGNAHNRRMKYTSSDDSEEDIMAGATHPDTPSTAAHGQSGNSLNSLAPSSYHPNAVVPFDTIGTLSERASLKHRKTVAASMAAGKSTKNGDNAPMMDSMMNNYGPSVKANQISPKSTSSNHESVKAGGNNPRRALSPTLEEGEAKINEIDLVRVKPMRPVAGGGGGTGNGDNSGGTSGSSGSSAAKSQKTTNLAGAANSVMNANRVKGRRKSI